MKPRETETSVQVDGIKIQEIRDFCCNKRQQWLWLLAKVFSCILLALLFLVAVFDPGFGKVLACLGVIVCCSLAAVIIDRRFRRGKYELSDLS